MTFFSRTLYAGLATLALAPAAHADFAVNPNLLRDIRPIRPQLVACADLQMSVSTEVVNGMIRISTRVRNGGIGAYSSNPNQQRIVLTQNGSPLATYGFSTLSSGGQLAWLAQVPMSDHTMHFRAEIQFDPSVATDGNSHNTDCNASNNSAIARVN